LRHENLPRLCESCDAAGLSICVLSPDVPSAKKDNAVKIDRRHRCQARRLRIVDLRYVHLGSFAIALVGRMAHADPPAAIHVLVALCYSGSAITETGSGAEETESGRVGAWRGFRAEWESRLGLA
jgi:hypothetical protein